MKEKKSPLCFSFWHGGVIYDHECEIVNLQEGTPGFYEGFESLLRYGVCRTLMLLHG